jgi:hypothetical protein
MALATAMAVISMAAIPSIIIYFVLVDDDVVTADDDGDDVDLSISPLLLFDLIIIISSFTSDIGIFAAKRQVAEATRRRDDATDGRNTNEAVDILLVR